MSEKKGDIVAAVEYYRIFVEKGEQARDGRIFAVKEKIAELEDTGQ